MRDKSSSEYAKATAACVNMAVDSIEDALEQELSTASYETAAVLLRMRERVRQQRLDLESWEITRGLH